MKRAAFVSVLASLLCAVMAGFVFAQAKSPASSSATQAKPTAGSSVAQAKPTTGGATATPAAPGKFVAPVRGIATIDVLPLKSKVVGKEIVTELKIKNTSAGAIHLLRVDELWYNKKRDMISSGTERYKKPLMPGEIVTIQVKSPLIGQPDQNQFTFAHANGKVEAKAVKKME